MLRRPGLLPAGGGVLLQGGRVLLQVTVSLSWGKALLCLFVLATKK